MEERLQECVCGCSMFTEVHPVELEEGALVVYRPGSTLITTSTTVPVLECIVCSRFVATRASFAGRNRLHPDVQMYARLMKVIDKHNEMIRKIENANEYLDLEAKRIQDGEEVYTKAEVDKLIEAVRAEVKKDVKPAGKTSRKTTKKDS